MKFYNLSVNMRVLADSLTEARKQMRAELKIPENIPDEFMELDE